MEIDPDLTRGFARLNLKARVGDGQDNDPEDVVAVKQELRRRELLKPKPGAGITGFIDRDTDQGIRAFQKRNGLKVDGRVAPDGETLRAMNRERLLRTMARNANNMEREAAARGIEGFSALKAVAEAREKQQQARRQATENETGKAAPRETDRANIEATPPDDGLRPSHPADNRAVPAPDGADTSGRTRRSTDGSEGTSKPNGKLAALAAETEEHARSRRIPDIGVDGLVSPEAAREFLDNMSGEDLALLGEQIGLPEGATREEIKVAIGPAVVFVPALFGLGLLGTGMMQNEATRKSVEKAANRALENAGDNLSDLVDHTREFFGADGEDAGTPATNDRPHHPAFQAIEPAPPEPPRDFDPEDVGDTPSSPPPLETTDLPTDDRLINLPADIQAEIEEFPILDPALARFGQIVHAHRGDPWTQRGINIEIRALIEAARPYLEPLKGKLTNFAGGKAEGKESRREKKERALKAFEKQRRGFSVPDAGLKADIASSPENLTEEERRIVEFFRQEILINTGLVRKDGTPVAPERRQKERLDRNIAARRKNTNDVERGIGIFRPKLRPGMDEAAFARESRAFFKQFLREKLGPSPGG